MNTNTYAKNNNEISNSKEDKSMTRTAIINELKNRGYNAEAQDVVKNGVTKRGVLFKTESNVSPVVYVEDLIAKGFTVSEIVDTCIEIFEENHNHNLSTLKEQLFSPDFLAENCYVGLQKSSDEDIVKFDTEFVGIEQYVYVRVAMPKGQGSIKLNQQILDMANVSEDFVLLNAMRNTFKETKLVSMAEMFGLPTMSPIGDVYLLTNTHEFKGASAILDKDFLKAYGEKHHVHHIIAIPSSIHEFIIMPYHDWDDIDAITAMVKEINAAEVKPEEQLADRGFILKI